MAQFGSIGGDLNRTSAMLSSMPVTPVASPRQIIAYGWCLTVLTVILIRVTVFIAGVVSVATVHSIDQVEPTNASGNSWIAFDCHFYRYNLLHGYPPGPEIPYQIAYFPFLSVVSRAFLPLCTVLFGADAAPRAALLIVANGCSLIGLCFFYAWVRSLFDARTAFISVVLLAVYPGAAFYCAGETEGPFLMFAAAALYLLQKQWLYSAALISAVATSTRPTAVCLALTVVVWTIYFSWHLPKKQLILRVLIIGFISIAGGLSYEAFLWHRYHHWDAFKQSEDKWDLQRDPIQTAKNQKLLEGVDQRWTFANTPAVNPVVANTVAANTVASSTAVANMAVTPNNSSPAESPQSHHSIRFALQHLLRASIWNRLIAVGLLVLCITAWFKPAGVPRLLLLLPSAIWLMSYLPNWGLRFSSIYRYEAGGIPLFVVLALWLSVPSRRPLLIIIAAISFTVQLYYAFLFSRGFWIG
jgi:hypothetical protein